MFPKFCDKYEKIALQHREAAPGISARVDKVKEEALVLFPDEKSAMASKMVSDARWWAIGEHLKYGRMQDEHLAQCPTCQKSKKYYKVLQYFSLGQWKWMIRLFFLVDVRSKLAMIALKLKRKIQKINKAN